MQCFFATYFMKCVAMYRTLPLRPITAVLFNFSEVLVVSRQETLTDNFLLTVLAYQRNITTFVKNAKCVGLRGYLSEIGFS